MWKVLAESVRGTSHAATNLECQDVARFARIAAGDDEYLVLVCADGAGSAKQAALGATTTCESILRSAAKELIDPAAALTESLITAWIVRAHADINDQAASLNLSPRDFACTLLLAVLGPASSAFAQIGDGVIVTGAGNSGAGDTGVGDTGAGDTFAHVFWPDSGEYQNTTYFLCESTYAEHLHMTIGPSVDEAAITTDGLQMLALKYADQCVHAPFFVPMFRALREAASAGDLAGPLRSFLDSPAVNARTDDDKTLILATRLPGERIEGAGEGKQSHSGGVDGNAAV